MASIHYTPSQRTAIDYDGGNLLLSAAAGSGKTATLTARILKLLSDGDGTGDVNLTDMLVVTYTRAAAGELRARISTAILQSTLPRPRMFRALTDVSRADISTIHAFLLKALRPYFPSLGLSPDMTVLDEAAVGVLKSAAMRDVIDDAFDRETKKDGHPLTEPANHAKGDPKPEPDQDPETEKEPEVGAYASFFELADALGAARDSTALDSVLIGMADDLRSVGRDEGCLSQYADLLEGDADHGFFQSVYGASIQTHVRRMLRHYHAALTDLGDTMGGEPKVTEKYGPALFDLLHVILQAQDAVETGDYEKTKAIFRSFAPVPLGRLSAKDKTETSETFKSVRERFKKDTANLASGYFNASEEELARSMVRTARILRRLQKVLAAYYRSFARRKRAQNALDYADLEALALKLFLAKDGTPTDAAKEVGSRYRYVFVDEYQDTNHVQDAIFRAISGRSVRFMVGDIKQSIYRFRGAEPEVFSEYRDRWPVLRPLEEEKTQSTRETQAKQKTPFSPDEGRCVFMSENFRCDEPVVRFVNMISGVLFPYGGIPYTEDDALICGKAMEKEDFASTKEEKAPEPVEICLIEKPRKTKNAEAEESTDSDDRFDPEAEYVADRITALLDETGAKPSDVAILTRNLRGTAEVYGEALLRRGLSVRVKSNVTPLSTRSAKLVVCLLHLVDNPLEEIYAAGAMRSPVFGFTTDELILLKRFGKEVPLYLAVSRAARLSEPEADYGYRMEEPEAAGEQLTLPLEPVPEREEPRENEAEASEESPLSSPADDPSVSQALSEKCVFLLRWVARQKQAARGMKADKYLEFLYNELELNTLPEIFRDAMERDALTRLYEMARRYESGRFGGISGFLEYLKENAGQESAEIGEENAVAIVSIHASKGLQYPICFLVGCGRERNQADERKDLLFDPSLGFGMKLPDEGGLVRCDTAVRRGIAEKKRVDGIREEMRVLYVAMTRAQHRLIITAKTTDANALLDNAERERAYTSEWSVLEHTAYRDWIVLAASKAGPADFYKLSVIQAADIVPYQPEETITQTWGDTAAPFLSEAEEKRQAEEVEALLDRFRFRYPLDFLSRVPAKLSVSRLTPVVLDDEEENAAATLPIGPTEESERPTSSTAVPLPSFMTGVTEVKAADKGTATHLFLQFMDLSSFAERGVDAELNRLLERRFLSSETADLVNRAHLEQFRKSELFRRMLRAPMIRREFRFNVRMAAERFTKDEAFAEKLREHNVKVTVQGVVDCVFRGENGLVLVDYKTDALTEAQARHPKAAEEKLRLRHRDQLLYYKEICERLFGEPIRETLVYSTFLGRTVPIW